MPPAYLSSDYDKLYKEGLFFNHLGFQVSYQTKFFMRLFDRETKKDYVTTEG